MVESRQLKEVPLSALVTNLEFFAAVTLELCGYPAAIFLGLYDSVDASGDPAGPPILAKSRRVGQVGALDVWMVEFAHVPEYPVTRKLRHALLFYREVEQRIPSDPIEPGHVADVLLVERNPLRIHYDHPGPEGNAIISVKFGMLLSHLAVHLGNQVQQLA